MGANPSRPCSPRSSPVLDDELSEEGELPDVPYASEAEEERTSPNVQRQDHRLAYQHTIAGLTARPRQNTRSERELPSQSELHRNRDRSRSPARRQVTTKHASRARTPPNVTDQPSSDTNTTKTSAETALAGCVCPINTHCPRRKNNLHDCRTLVLEWKRWLENYDANTYHSYRAVPPCDAPLVTIDRLRAMVHACQRFNTLPSLHRNLKGLYRTMSDWSKEIRLLNVDETLLNNSQVLVALKALLAPSNDTALLTKRFPISLREDLTVVLRKWTKGDYDVDPNRGLSIQSTHDEKSVIGNKYVLNKSWPHYVSANEFGDNGLINGQIWYSRHQLMRDGAHSPSVAGISGSVSQGAYSVVMGYHDTKKQEYYADIDKGDMIEYYGTALRDNGSNGPTNVRDPATHIPINNKPTKYTLMLKKSLKTGTPVRVIRSYKLAPIVAHRPNHGEYRYDGLYQWLGKHL